MNRAEIVARDKARVWHPYTAMDAWAAVDPIVVARAEGARLYDVDGRSYLDGNSSWYVATLGHAHPRVLAALERQARTLAHCALAGIAHEQAASLAEELVAIAPRGLTRVFYTDDGSTAVEVAAKICVQAWRQRGAQGKTRFVALDGAFHGDSIGAASLGGVEVFRRPFAGVLFDCARAPFPEEDAYERAFSAVAELVTKDKDRICAVFVEPIVQGAAGMRVYPPMYLKELRSLCDRSDVLLVFDEVFSGYGRTGRMWASEHAGVTPDVMCVGKAFAQILPMGATLVTEAVFDAFRGSKDKALMYGHTMCGNPLGAAVAREVLAIYKDERIVERVRDVVAPRIEAAFARIGELPGVERVRTIGAVGAADLTPARGAKDGYLGERGWKVYEEARKRGAYLRPLGDTVYVTPPLVISENDLDELLGILEVSLRA
jgi:adenosylmethionine-8-amino-7-oxononanoate aminotransferase